MDNPHYCSTGWSLYHQLAEAHMNYGKVPGEIFKRDLAAAQSRLGEHMKACAQGSIEEFRFEKKRATSVR
jgi:hypothetical protein